MFFRRILVARYSESIDLSGKNLIGLAGADRVALQSLIPQLQRATEMKRKLRWASRCVAYNGEIADEIHEFTNASWGDDRLSRIMLREGRIIEIKIEGKSKP